MKTLALVALLFLTATHSTMATENVAPVRSEDPEMMAAIQQARDSFRKFLNAYMSPTPKQSAFLVKIAFVKGSDVEHIWLADLDLAGAKPTGVIADTPIRKDLRFKQRVEIDFTYLSDWMYIEDGKLVGGFTTRLLRNRMSSEERKKLDAMSAYRFE
jgi:uncharacterized protein YegJ (DUF2314 family)